MSAIRSDAVLEGDIAIRLAALHTYPIKSCAGFSLDEALLIETGIDLDRLWMLVDPDGRFVTQRVLPRMALVATRLRHGELVLRAPGMLPLHLKTDTVDAPLRVQVWRDEVAAYDMGPLAAQWFSTFLGQPVRLVRFDPEQRRLADLTWTSGFEAETSFSDGFPLLVLSAESLADLNRRLAAAGTPAVTIERFRPNLVVEGLPAHGEDELDELRFTTPQGPVRIRLVKPCTRCAIPNIDPLTAETGDEPNRLLATYRGDARMGGAVTFGMNGVILEGIDCVLKPGMQGMATYRF